MDSRGMQEITNIEHIHDVDGSTVNLQNGMELKIGTHFRKAFLEKLLMQGEVFV